MAIEFNLPIEIIQHIQSFLSPKLSTQTCILSKLWFKAWATPPTLCLYQKYFPEDSDQFWNFSMKSLQRYIDMNLKLDKLFLRIHPSSNCTHFLDQLIIDALNLGLNVLRLESGQTHDFVYVLPAQVFDSKSLTELYVSYCQINHRLFWACRPSFISLPPFHDGAIQQLLYEQLILNDNKDLFRMYNLEKVNLEFFENNRKEWQTILPEELINVPAISHYGKQTRFRLSWGLTG